EAGLHVRPSWILHLHAGVISPRRRASALVTVVSRPFVSADGIGGYHGASCFLCAPRSQAPGARRLRSASRRAILRDPRRDPAERGAWGDRVALPGLSPVGGGRALHAPPLCLQIDDAGAGELTHRSRRPR